MKRRDVLIGSAGYLTAAPLLRAQAETTAGPAPNPYLSAPIYGITHFNSAQTDTFPYAAPKGIFPVDLTTRPRIPGGPMNLMTFAAAQPGFMWAIGTDRIAYVDSRNGARQAVTERSLSGVKRVSPAALQALVTAPTASVAALEKKWQGVARPPPHGHRG